jgi:hypothetical protein
MVLYLCVLIVFSLHRESLKLILVDGPLPEVVLSHLVSEKAGGNTLVAKNHNYALSVRIAWPI